MTVIDLELRGEFITLDALLKATGIASSDPGIQPSPRTKPSPSTLRNTWAASLRSSQVADAAT